MANTAELFSPLHSISFTFVSRCVVCVCMLFFIFFFSFVLFVAALARRREKHKFAVCVLVWLKPFHTVFVPCWHQDGHARETGLGYVEVRAPFGGQPTTLMSVLHPRRFGLGFLVLFHAFAYPSESWLACGSQRRGYFFFFSFFLFVLSFGW